jgi:hypothetical protein
MYTNNVDKGGLTKLYDEELRNFQSSPNITGVISPRRRWAGHVTRMQMFQLKPKLFPRQTGLSFQ